MSKDQNKPDKNLVKYSYEETLEASTKYFREKLPATVWADKYAMRDSENNLLELVPDDMHDRLADEFARIDHEKYGLDYDIRRKLYREALHQFSRVVPQGSPMSAVGNRHQVMSASNCVVVESPEDSIAGIMKSGTELAQLYKRRAGVGIDISTLRPDGFKVNNAARTTSGAWSFADFFSYVTRMIGQCLSADTTILTRKGLKEVKNITTDDEVWTKNGWVKVVGFVKNRKPTVKLTTDYGREIICSKEHVFHTILGEKKVEEMITQDHPISCIIGEGWEGEDIELQNYPYPTWELTNKSSRLCLTVEVPQKLDTELAYFLGYSYGDGHIGRNKNKNSNVSGNVISLATSNDWPLIREKLINIIKNIFNYDASVSPRPGEGCANVNLYSTLIINHLEKNGLLKQKAGSLVFPACLYRAKSEIIFAFLSGVFDADGDVSTKKAYRLRSICKPFLLSIQNVLMAFGIPTRISVEDRTSEEARTRRLRNNEKDLYTLSVNGGKAQAKFYNLMESSVKVRSFPLFAKKRDFCRTVYTTSDFGTRAGKHSYVIDDRQFITFTTSDRLLEDTSATLEPRLLQDYVASIEEYSSEEDVYDLILESEHLFFANGLYAHNSGRRGALMITLDVHHPDVVKFATMKSDLTKVTGANVSIRLSDSFLEAVDKDADYEQYWPMEGPKQYSRMVKARDVWKVIIDTATKTAEPGLIFWDRMTQYLPANSYKQFRSRSTNPCSEISLSAYDSCRLISLNLTGYVRDAFTNPVFDWELFKSDIKLAVQMCDNLVDLELELIDKIKLVCDGEDEKNLWCKLWQAGHDGRRTGLGTHGVGDALAQLNVKYDSDEALDWVNRIYQTLCYTSYETSTELAKVRGPFPVWDWNVDKDNKFIQSLPEELQNKIKTNGRRNIAMLTQAPTGSVSIISKCGEFDRWNVSSGVEPVFRNFYIRKKKINPNDKARVDYKDALGDTWQEYPVFHPNVKNYLEKIRGFTFDVPDDQLDAATIQKLKDEKLPDFFVTSDQIDWKQRVRLQGAEQAFIDHSISSCITAGQYVHTSTGLKLIEDLIPKDLPEKNFGSPTEALQTKNHEDVTVNIDEVYNNGDAECVEVAFDEGHYLKCTKNHKLLVLNEEYQTEWKMAGNLTPFDYVVCRTALNCFGDSQKYISSVMGEFSSPLLAMRGNTKEVTLPKRMTRELARLLGYLLSDGSINENGISLSQVKNNVIDDFIILIKSVFNCEVSISYDRRSDNLMAVSANSRILRDYFEYLGLTRDHSTIKVPRVIFECAGRTQCAEFLKGVTLDGYVSEEKLVLHTTTSRAFAEGTLMLLNQFGISANFMTKPPGEHTFPGGKTYSTKESYSVYCGMDAGAKFADTIGFAESRKTEEIESKFKRTSRKLSLGSVPNFGLREAARVQLLPKIKSNQLYNIMHSATSKWKNEFDLSRETMKMFCDFGFDLPNQILLSETHIFRKVSSVTEIGVHPTYDLHIKNGNSYIVNDIVSHNTINLPKGTTSDVVGGIYLEGWKNKLKGITVYVDGSRDGVLVTESTKKIDPTVRPDKIITMSAPKRPKSLPCEIHYVTVDGRRWTVMVGLFSGTPYEVFLGYSEQLQLPSKYKSGSLVKASKGKYQLHVGEGDDELVIKDVVSVFNNPQSAWATRLLSMSMRHGVPLEYLIDVLSKDGRINDINRVIARVLKKYIPEGAKVTTSTSCQFCKGTNLRYQEGCIFCIDCGLSPKCS